MKVTNLLGLASFGILSLVSLSACSENDGSQYSNALECMNSETKDGADKQIAIEFCNSIFAKKDMDREISCRADPTGSGCAPYVDRARRVEELRKCTSIRYRYKDAREDGYSAREIITYLEKKCAESQEEDPSATEPMATEEVAPATDAPDDAMATEQ